MCRISGTTYQAFGTQYFSGGWMPRTGYRIEQVNEFLRTEISAIIRQERDEFQHLGMVSVTEVQTAPDLRHAKVYVSTLGGEAERDAAVVELRRHARHLRHMLAPRITFRTVPELDFRADSSLETGAAVYQALQQVERMRIDMPEDLAPLPEPIPTPKPRTPSEPKRNPRARRKREE